MPFVNSELSTIYEEICQRQVAEGRLSLVEFDDAEYDALLNWARQIVRRYEYWWQQEKRKQSRLVFLTFAMAFVRRHKYTEDNVFWPNFEQVLGLYVMEHRPLMMDDLLWPAYEEEGLELQHDGRGRRIVGTLESEIRQADGWVILARAQFIEFFKWYYAHCPDKDISPILIAEYSKQTRTSFFVPDIVLPIFTRDCQRLVQVLDFAIENQLYLESGQLDDYRNEVVVHLGPDYDPARLYLIRDQRELIRLIREVQNHITPTQFERYLRSLPQDLLLTAPCGKSQPIHLALKHWLPLPYGMYHLKDETYRVVPHRRLRLETLDEWPSGRVILLWGRMLGYKKQTPFQVSIGRRAIDAIPYVRSHSKKTYIWAGEAPLGQKFAIDGQLRGESAGADWQVTLRLIGIEREEPGLCIAVTRLMLYYPETPHQRICISSSAGYKYEDTLREDGVRRFHLHRELAIPLNNFDAAIDIGVTVGDNVVLQKTFTPEPVYLFSVSNHELVGARSVADFGDRKYILFVRDSSIPIAGEGVTIQRLRKPFGAFTLYQVTWEDPKHHFSLRVGAYHWAFLQRREFAILFTPPQPPDHLRLKPNQILSFETLSLRLYSTANLTTMDLKLELYDDDSLLCQIDLTLHINPESTEYFFEVNSEIWKELQSQAGTHYGRYLIRFRDNETVLGEHKLSLVPQIGLGNWDENVLHLETKPIDVNIVSPDCPVWNSEARQSERQTTLHLRPRVQAEPWSEQAPIRRIASQPISALVSFPDLYETLDIVIRPQLFGFRLYQKRTEQPMSEQRRLHYQPLHQADYYHLEETALYVFAAPDSQIELAVGARTVWTGETDNNGDLWLDNLKCLKEACINEDTFVTLRCGKLDHTFGIRWTPMIEALSVEDETIVLRYNGLENTYVRLSLRSLTGEILWEQNMPCMETSVTEHIPLPNIHPRSIYLIAEYILMNGDVRPSAWQVHMRNNDTNHLPAQWWIDGIGISALEDVQSIGLYITYGKERTMKWDYSMTVVNHN